MRQVAPPFSRWAATATAFLSILWLGVLLGVSFLATPVKFQAESLTLPIALEVGRVTFALLIKVEWGLCFLLIGAILIARPPRWCWIVLIALVLILLVESIWLLPILDARVGEIMAGVEISPSSHHFQYIAAELLKALLLLSLSIRALAAPYGYARTHS